MTAAPARRARPTVRDHPGGVSPTGGLVLDADLVDIYVNSYLANIHILHPFLEIKVLQDMVTRFKRRYSWGHMHLQHRGLSTGKRKRAEDSPGDAIALLNKSPQASRISLQEQTIWGESVA
jgi:hypothetical protein